MMTVKVLTAVRQRMLFCQTITDVWCYFERWVYVKRVKNFKNRSLNCHLELAY